MTPNNEKMRASPTPAESAATKTPTTIQPTERELHITIHRDDCFMFTGTAAQLTAEGLIPDGLKWPKLASRISWEANGFYYWLGRARPEGHKGSRSSWLELDNWMIRVTVIGRDLRWCQARAIERMVEEMRDAQYRSTSQGYGEWREADKRYTAAFMDEAFQAFRKKIPALAPKKRGRKAKPKMGGDHE